MTKKLHLGVIEVPYSRRGGVSTGDVAQWLENKYGVMEHFVDAKGPLMAEDFASSVAGAIDNVVMGAPVGDPFADACAETEARFRDFITSREAERVGIPGTPTQAALKGVNHRFKRKRSGRRPSFDDTGAYMAAFKAWVK